jgi:hypothetical protein
MRQLFTKHVASGEACRADQTIAASTSVERAHPDVNVSPGASYMESARSSDPQAYAIAELVDVLAFGEDSAVLTFEHMAKRCSGAALYSALKGIAADESRHQAWLARLQQSLPLLTPDAAYAKRLRRFFYALAHEDLEVQFARIFALDSAVCQLLAAVQSHCTPALAAEVNPIFTRIRRDEARHVGVARWAAGPLLGTSRGKDLLTEVREGLTQVLAYRATAFETLRVDPDRLFSRLRRAPRCGAIC